MPALIVVGTLLAAGPAEAAPDSLVLSPKTATNDVLTKHTITATVTDAGTPVAGVQVLFTSSLASFLFAFATTDGEGHASLTYTGNTVGTETITAFVDTNGNFEPDAGEPSDSASKEWLSVVGNPDLLILTPKTAANDINTQHTVTATVTAAGKPAPGFRVFFTTSFGLTHDGTTDAAGEVTFTYTGRTAGNETITAFADTNRNTEPDVGEPSDTATKEWRVGKLEVRKALLPGADPGRFNLLIDARIEKANATDGDSTGERTVPPGVHTIGETAVGTSLANYTHSIACRDQNGNGSIVAQTTRPGLRLTVNGNDDIVCTITNTRARPTSTAACGDVITKDTKLNTDLIDCPGDGLVIGADDITLDLNGHTIAGFPGGPNSAPDGVDNGAGHKGLQIRDGTIRDFSGDGVYLDNGTTEYQLRRIDLTSNAIGTEVINSSNGVIEKVNASKNKDFGLIVRSSTGNIFRKNLVSDNGSDGFLIQGADDNLFMESSVSGNSNTGMQIFSSDKNVFQKNTLKENGLGMFVTGSTQNEIENNRVSGSADSPGIFLGGASGNDLEGNFVSHNDIGIILDSSDKNEIEENSVSENTTVGIALKFSNGNVVSKNRTRGNEIGIAVRDGDGTLVKRNEASENAGDGISVLAAQTTLTRNKANRNGDLGIDAVQGVIDGGHNRAKGNGNVLQCTNVRCH